MDINYSIKTFACLGDKLSRQLRDGALDPVIGHAVMENPWFTRESVAEAIQAICTDMLTEQKLEHWLKRYSAASRAPARRVGIVMAGNIPLVGFSDLLCVLACGYRCLVKPSSKDRILIEYVIGLLRSIAPERSIEPLGAQTPDLLIATGSDAARRHFETAYPGIPALLRGSRHSVAVLSGRESDVQLDGLGTDIFLYFGLGCRNVSRLFVPEGYDLEKLTDRLSRQRITHRGYLNNYRQTRAMLAMQGAEFTDGGFFILRPDQEGSQRISELTYTFYSDLHDAERQIAEQNDRIQCIVSDAIEHPRRADFGQAQHPSPADYPDGVDVIDFLLRHTE